MIDTPADRPRALVVYESMFGCTEQVTRAVAAGLEEGGCDVVVQHVRDTGQPRDLTFDLLVVGGPTHAFSLSRPSTRQDAVRQGAPAEVAGPGLDRERRRADTRCRTSATNGRRGRRGARAGGGVRVVQKALQHTVDHVSLCPGGRGRGAGRD